MRTFWIAILVLAVAVAVIAWLSRAEDARKNAPPMIDNTDVTVGTSAPTNTAIGVPGSREVRPPVPSNDAAREAAAGALRPPGPPPTAAPESADAEHNAQTLADELAASSEEGQGEDVSDALNDGSVPTPAQQSAASSGKPIVDGTYVLGGDGSVEHPYEITWDLLILASQTYQPRQGKTDIPPAVQAMNGKHIKIAGYFAIPIATTDPKEVLFMLNMWDGCCIGVPPSPYDAIEVRLREPMSGPKQIANYGTLSGTLKVDPYVENNWLLGMYLMEDGAIEAGL